jgi:hypothetical protein
MILTRVSCFNLQIPLFLNIDFIILNFCSTCFLISIFLNFGRMFMSERSGVSYLKVLLLFFFSASLYLFLLLLGILTFSTLICTLTHQSDLFYPFFHQMKVVFKQFKIVPPINKTCWHLILILLSLTFQLNGLYYSA